jgi:hypothetical protein
MDRGHLVYLLLGLGVFSFWLLVGAIAIRRERSRRRRGWRSGDDRQANLPFQDQHRARAQ